ncbi:MAG: prepilin peptidase [Anaerolineae bacterium]
MPSWIGTAFLLATLGIAAVTDVRSRKVPRWLTTGSMALALLVAASGGSDALLRSVLGLLVGGLLLLPFVLLGGFGLADALLLGAVGAWQGWDFVLHAAAWMALIGGALALAVRWRGGRNFPYVPAIACGAVLALAVQ